MLTPTTTSTISKLFSVLREKIRIYMHSYWDKNLLGLEINMDLGYPSV